MRWQRRNRRALCGWGAFLLVLVAARASHAQVMGPELQAVLEETESGEEISVIVDFVDEIDLSSFPGSDQAKSVLRALLIRALQALAEATQAPVISFLSGQPVSRLTSLWINNDLALTAGPDVIQAVANFPAVEGIRLDATVNAPQPGAGSASMLEWNLDAIRAPDFWSLGHTGGGIIVAALDTGVDADHQDLASRWRGGSNSWFDPNGEHLYPYDKSGHGTQVMGLMVGGGAGGSAIGVAPDAEWIAVKIFNDAGVASASAIHQGFQWILDPDGNPGSNDSADVVNNSWGYPDRVNQCYLEFEPDIEVLKVAGIAVVFSGGNGGPYGSTSESPANNPEGFGVGAVDDFNSVASFSSRGPSACDGRIYPEVVAPGVNVRSADLTFGGAIPGSYAYVTGTSFAAPHLSGAMALLMSAHPEATVAELEQALKDAALDLGDIDADNSYGYGLIDVVAAGDLLSGQPGPTCTDADSDGFFLQAGCGSALDCNDSEPNINPAACDIKGDGIDQDCDGQDRTRGKDCPPSDGGGDPTTGAEGKAKTCSDGADNDGDGLVDCADPDCSGNKSCK